MTYEEFKPPARLDLFFRRLHEIKQGIKLTSEMHPEKSVQGFARAIYEELHELYKTQEEHENNQCNDTCNNA